MKINASARYLVRIRAIMLGVALAAVIGAEVYLFASLAARSGQTTGLQTDSPAAPSASISDLMAAAR
jgi:hypothetical protein